MTYAEFTYTLQNGGLGAIDDTVVVNYNVYPDGLYRVDAVAILIDGNLEQLQQATSISTIIPSSGQIVTILVESIPSRVVERGRIGDFFMYYILTSGQGPVIYNPTIGGQTAPVNGETYFPEVSIEPVTATGAYSYNTYNPLIGNSIIDRESSYLVHCDRGTTTETTKTNPVNIFSIISDQAVRANVQDSLYSDTGWSNGRYEGSKTTAQGYGGIDPTITGISFTGAYYPITLTDTDITTATIDTRVIQEYFLIPGKGVDTSVPVVTSPADSTKTAVYKATGQLTATRTVFDFTVISGAVEKEPIKVGDYLYLYNVNEIVKVEQVAISGGTSTTTVKRYMFGTNPTKTTSLIETTTRVLTDINRVYQVESNRIEFLGEGKVWVQASGDILRMDELGYSATGSIAT